MKLTLLKFLILCNLVLLSTAFGEPPCLTPFNVISANNNFLATIVPCDKSLSEEFYNGVEEYPSHALIEKLQEGNWEVIVYELDVYNLNLIEVWRSDYHFTGSSHSCWLSSDGNIVGVVEQFYQENKPVVSIYQKDKNTINLNGSRFKLDKKQKLSSCDECISWLKAGYHYSFADRGGLHDFPELTVHTIDKKIHKINLETGEHSVKDGAFNYTFDFLHYFGSEFLICTVVVLILNNLVILFSWFLGKRKAKV